MQKQIEIDARHFVKAILIIDRKNFNTYINVNIVRIEDHLYESFEPDKAMLYPLSGYKRLNKSTRLELKKQFVYLVDDCLKDYIIKKNIKIKAQYEIK